MGYNSNNQVKHIIDSRQFTLEFLNRLFERTDQFVGYDLTGNRRAFPRYQDRRLVEMFSQPSTRTVDSFAMAGHALGMSVTYYSEIGKFSSFAKGADLEHEIQAIGRNYDVLVIRHHENGIPYRASIVSIKPVINGGDGTNQHPTQALLDAYTIYDHLQTINGLNIVFVGECDGRVTRSLAYLLAKHGKDNKFFFVAPQEFQAPDEFLDYLRRKCVEINTLDDIEDLVGIGDVFYSTRLRKERIEEMKKKESESELGRKLTEDEEREVKKNAAEDYAKLREKAYPKTVIDNRRACGMKKTAIIHHPLPIDVESGYPEITKEIDRNLRQAYLEASRKGWALRAALLEALLDNQSEIYSALDDPNYEKIWHDIYNGNPEYSPERLRQRTEWIQRSDRETLDRLKRREQKRLEAGKILI